MKIHVEKANFLFRLTDQIEFANVILLNKVDMVKKDEVDKVERLIKILNP